jgi:hypothetical protein
MKPGKVETLKCVNCKELLIKVYPWCPGWNAPREGLYCRKDACQKAYANRYRPPKGWQLKS